MKKIMRRYGGLGVHLVLDKVLSFPKLPTTEEGLHGVARGFKTSRKHTSPLDGCVGALGGICIKIAKPDRGSNPAFLLPEGILPNPCPSGL